MINLVKKIIEKPQISERLSLYNSLERTSSGEICTSSEIALGNLLYESK
jgi:hypothetical protein